MKLSIQNITIKDLIALITIVGGFYLIATGKDGRVGMTMILVISFYFGHMRKNYREAHNQE